MNRSARNPISDELLSAYIDGAVTNEERATVEAALSADPALTWELESLRRTVELVQALPPITLPRSFALAEEQVADMLTERRARAVAPVAARPPRQPVVAPRRGFWQELLAFFHSGNLLLRNATAVAAVLFVVVLVTSPTVAQQNNPVLLSARSPIQLQADLSAPADSEAEPALAATGEAAPASAIGAAPVAQSATAAAPMAEMAPAAEAVPPGQEVMAMDAAPPGMDPSASSAAMRAGPESLAAPAARTMPEARGGGIESGPVAFQAVPADVSPVSEESAAASELRQPIDAGIEAAPVAESAAEISADAPVTEESPEAVAIQSAPAETLDEPAVQESELSVVSDELDFMPIPAYPRVPWAYWGWLQAALGGLALLLGALWLYTRRA